MAVFHNEPLPLFFFYSFAVIAVAGALATISLRNPVHCAVGLLLSLLGVAGVFLQSHAEFLFSAQLIVYAGGVVLLFLFVIMLVNLDRVRLERRFATAWPLGLVCAGIAAIQLVILFRGASWNPLQGEMPGANTEAFGTILLTEYLLPFEIVSILLLVALVGAVTVARSEA